MPKCLLTLLFCMLHASFAIGQTKNASIPLFFEKTYLHTDRDMYTPGDTLWFKAYLVNAQDNKLDSSSGNLHVELISPDAKVISAELIRLEGGTGNGDFDLPDSLVNGTYRLRAYTNWMRNFGDNFIFEKDIIVLSDRVAAAEKKAAGNEASAGKKTIAETAPATATATLPLIRFYPEGGSLVEGLSSLVAVKADDGFGHGLTASGVVLSAIGDTISRFSCDSLGMGLFALLPVKGQAYHAMVKFAGGMPKQVRHDMTFELPSALSKGLTLQVKQTDTSIRAVISSNADYTTAAVKPMFTLTVKHGGVTLLSQSLQLTGNQSSIRIPTAGLPEGIAAITLYDEGGKPNCERLVYIHQSVNNKAAGVSILTDKKSYLPKEKVIVSINAPAGSSLSMAVVDAGIVPEQADDILSYLLLSSEIKGNIEHARRYFDTTNVNRFKQLDLLLLTQGWRDFIWRRLADTSIRISYAAENGNSISGKVRDEVNEKPMPGLTVTLYASEAKGDKLFTATTDKDGRFGIDNLLLYNSQRIQLSAVNAKGKKAGTFDLDTIKTIPINPVNKTFSIPSTEEAITGIIEKRNMQLKKLNLHKTVALKEVTVKAKTLPAAFSTTHDKRAVHTENGIDYLTWGPLQTYDITPKDYWTKTLTWYLIQNVPGAKIATPPRPGVIILNAGYPILVVNGSAFHIDYNLYYNMPIQKFKKIELQPVIPPNVRSLIPGSFLFLTTKENALTDNPGSIDTGIEGYYQARTFYQPPPNAKPSVYDYRTTIHWQPSIKTDADGKAMVNYYNGANSTPIRVIVQGVDRNGVLVAAIRSYEVN